MDLIIGGEGEAAPTLILGNAKKGMALDITFNPNKFGLPIFQYGYLPLYPGPFQLTEKRYPVAETCKGDFFNFVKELAGLNDRLTLKRAKKVFSTFFTSRKKAYRMLEELKADVEKRRRKKTFSTPSPQKG